MNKKKIGLPPGSLTHIGHKKTEYVDITAICYNKTEVFEKPININDVEQYKFKSDVNWINIDGLHDIKLIEKIGAVFGIHNLVLEDILNTFHRPKSEFSNQQLFFTLKMLFLDQNQKTIDSEQVSFILAKDYLISFQEKKGDVFETVRKRIKNENSLIRKNKVDFLFYSIVDAIVDNYFIVVEYLSEEANILEEKILKNFDKEYIEDILSLKKKNTQLKKACVPLREAISVIHKDETNLIRKETQQYLRDVYEHIIQVIEFSENLRDTISNIMDLYHAENSNKMNQIMQVLTVISTIFIPITFIAGIYGMNFENMPELKIKYGYYYTWALMILCVLAMLYYFKKKKWL